MSLSPVAVRVLGALLEKAHTTPENYPLSLNALVLACNQKTSRDPVTAYSERDVEEALQGLRDRGLVSSSQGVSERVVKHQHRLEEALSLSRPDLAVLAVLMLRGPQTAGELRSRTERYTHFPDVAAVEASLRRLAEHRPRSLAPKRALPARARPAGCTCSGQTRRGPNRERARLPRHLQPTARPWRRCKRRSRRSSGRWRGSYSTRGSRSL